MVRLGYDSITTVLVTYIATQIGFASSWMNPFCVVVAQGIAGYRCSLVPGYASWSG